MADVAYQLASQISGDVRFDRMSRLLYSTDASMYQIEPAGVVLPRSKQDVIAVIKYAREKGLAIIPRGGGTGLAGGVVGSGLVMDMSKYMNAIIELNTDESWVRAEPGVILDELNAYLKPHGLQFAPDVATSSRATIGGMVANNSAGAHSVIYGKTIDHVIELDVILADGSEATLGPLDETEVHRKCALMTLEGQAYRETIQLARTHAEEIERRYPKILRRVGGYNLDEFIKKQPFNLARIVVGSEGTLATIVSAKLNLVPLPKAKVLAIIQFDTLIESMRAVPPILTTQPAAIELIDKMILDQTRSSLELSSQRAWVQGDPEAVLAVEYYGDSLAELSPKLDALEALMKENGLGYAFGRAATEAEQANIWNVRKAGLGLLMGVKGDSKPVAFVEDQAVSPEKLPDYIAEFDAIISKHHTHAGYYAHASVGLLHIRPMVNLKIKEDIIKMRSIAEDVRDLVMKYGGAISGEHGDGLVRSCWNEKFFGSQLYGAFRDLKKAFDPSGLMNPGKIVDAPMMTENLRYGPDYRSHDMETHFDFTADGGFHRAIEMCNGVGACRKKNVSTMCPSFMATLDEEHSTRGRANALRAAISGKWEGGLTDKRMHDVMDLCLECKACKSECPSGVDMAKIKYEFLAHYYKKNGRPLRAVLFGHIEALSKLGCMTAPFSNWLATHALSRWAMKKLGIAENRSLPPFANETFPQWFAGRKPITRDKKVVLFHDTYMDYNYPEIGRAATLFLEAAGFEVILAVKRCCGRPLLSSGYIEAVKENARSNVAHLHRYVEQGYPIVGFEPSCVSMLRDDYCDLIDDSRAKIVAKHVTTFEDFVGDLAKRGELNVEFTRVARKVLLHGHCHQKALWGVTGSLGALNLPEAYQASAIASGCCGMAGSFGYEAEHYEVSLKVGESRLLKVVRDADDSTEIVAGGLSCRQQIQHATGKRAKHPAELLWEALKQNDV
jgi:FAD/FMN-containing dehydrogenase/Fe-S oxidoreductase